MIGQVIGNYRIVAELGQGGMGVVYRAEHVQLGRPAALKVLLPQMSSDAQIVQRFFNEARAASSIDHPGIVEIYDFGRHTDGRAYIVMEMLRGESLDHRLMRPIAPLEAASLIAQVAGALSAAHARGIVHRDLKPDNIFLVPNELLPGGIQVKLLDFGIAKLTGEGGQAFRTQTGVLIGTPAYMSPEQCMGRPDLDHRTDLYSIGCILYHMLCRRPPFLSEQGTGVMIAMHLRDPVPDPRTLAPHLPEPLVAIMLRLLEKDPAARYQSAQELRQALVMAGAIAPMTNPNVTPDAYGATMAGGSAGAGTHQGGWSGAGHSPDSAYGATPAYAPTPAPTTRSRAAAEVMTRPERGYHHSQGDSTGARTGGGGPAGARTGGGGPTGARTGGGRGVWIAVGALLLVGGGVAAGVAVTQGDGGGEVAVTTPSPEGGSSEVKPAVTTPEVAKPAVPPTVTTPTTTTPTTMPEEIKPTVPLAELPCPPGQLRNDDTRGECCWAGQAWSTAKKRCIGTPTCPPGGRARGESCIMAEADPALIPQPLQLDPDPLASAPSLQLSAPSFAPGASIEIAFSPAIRSATGRRAWVTVAPAGSSQTSYGTWKYVENGARRASLAAPDKPGAYEVRLHTDYPAKAFNVVRSVPFAVAIPAEANELAQTGPTPRSGQRFTLISKTAPAGGKAEVRFPASLRAAPGEQFWMTVIDASESDSGWGKWSYVPAGAQTMSLPVPTQPGAYEIRLHANYPKKSSNVVFRAPLRVESQ